MNDFKPSNLSSSSSEDVPQAPFPAPLRPRSSGPRTGSGAPPDRSAEPSAGAQQIADHMLGDQPAKNKDEDRLGFGPYVAAVAKFLTDSSTKIPLTLSIEGLWGSGKSSFMLLLQEVLRGSGKVVAFNAWQYNADDGLWAAFIHEFDDGLYKQLTWAERIRARLMLLKLRVRWQGLTDTLAVFLWLGGSVAAFIAIAAYLTHGGIAMFLATIGSSGKIEESTNKTIALVGGIGGVVASLLLFLKQVKVLFKSPASFDKAARLFARQNYDRQLPLIHQVTRDFNSLVSAYAGKGNVYLFIDDLDRCDYSRAAELMQALLMLLSSAPNIALIIGLDRDKVAAAMATKQEKLIPYLYRIAPGDAYKRGMEYGQRFIEKFIQVSFVLPAPRPNGLKAMVNPDVKPPMESVPESRKSEAAINIVTGKDDSQTLNEIIEMAGEVFDHNPRNVKQFVNMFRLQAFIANETGLFGSSSTGTRTGRPLTIPQLGKFVMLRMRWPDLMEDAITDPELVRKLESQLRRDTQPKNPEELTGQAANRAEEKGLMKLIGFRLSEVDSPASDFALSDVNFRNLNAIAPLRPKGSAKLAQELEPAENFKVTSSPRPASRSGTERPQRASK